MRDISRNWKLHHDNTPVCTAFFVSGLVFDDKVSNSALLPYSPEVVPLDILLFFHLKSQPKGHHFRTIDAIQVTCTITLKAISELALNDGFTVGN
ncbi:hypothetical protein TNCV_1136241 [Trichonephila clavipes]|nr:hypothetical protein TNCV_1136241 [Trichonephila clavipes]